MICFGWVLWHINPCRLSNTKSSLYICIKYIWFGLVGSYGILTPVCYLMQNPLYTYILNTEDLVWFDFMAYQTIIGYLILDPLYTNILNMYDLVWLSFMAYQPLLVI